MLDVLIFRDSLGVSGSGEAACQAMCDAFNTALGIPGYYAPRPHPSNFADPSIPAEAMPQGPYHCVECTNELITALGSGASICRALVGEGATGSAPAPLPAILVNGIPLPGVMHASWGY